MGLLDFTKIDFKKRSIMSAILLPLIIVLIVFFAVRPAMKDIKSIKNDIEAQRIDLEIKYKKGMSLKDMISNLEIIGPQLSKLNKIYINQDEVLQFITTLEETASNNGVTQKINLATSKDVAKDARDKKPLQLTTNGNFIKQLNYLIDLETLDYYINVNSLELSKGSSRTVGEEGLISESTVNLLIIADTYWQQ